MREGAKVWFPISVSIYWLQVRFITARASRLCPSGLQPVDMSDMGNVMDRCSETDLEAHDNRVSFCAWQPKRCLLATRYFLSFFG